MTCCWLCKTALPEGGDRVPTQGAFGKFRAEQRLIRRSCVLRGDRADPVLRPAAAPG